MVRNENRTLILINEEVFGRVHRQALDMSRAGSITLPDRPGRNLKRPLAAIAIQKRRGKTRHSFLAAKSSPNLGWISSK